MTMGWNETQTQTSWAWAIVRCARDECDNNKTETDYEDCNTTRILTCSPSVFSRCTHCWASCCASCWSCASCRQWCSCRCDRPLNMYPKLFHISHRENGSSKVLSLHLLDQFTNTKVLSLFQNWMWQSKCSGVIVNLVQHWLLVTLRVTCVTANNGCPCSVMICFVSNVEIRALWEERVWETPCTWLASQQKKRVSPFYHDLGLDLVGLIGNFSIVEQLVHPVVEQLLNTNSFIQSCIKETFGGIRGDSYTFSYMISRGPRKWQSSCSLSHCKEKDELSIWLQFYLNIDMKIIRPVKFSGVTLNLDSNSWTFGRTAMWWFLGRYSTRIPLAHHQLCPKLCTLVNFWTTSTCPPMQYLIVGSRSSFQSRIQNLTIRKPSRARDRWLVHHQQKDEYFHE